jgi:hypothetical protein
MLIVAGLAGFAGGVAFSIARPLFRRLGRLGAFATGWLCVFAYLCVAAFGLRSDDPRSRNYFSVHDRGAWIAVAVGSILFGSMLGAAFAEDGKPARLKRVWVQRKQRVTSRVHPPAP